MKLSIAIGTCWALLAGAGIVRASEFDLLPADPSAICRVGSSREPVREDSLGLKSPQTATRLSAIGTLVPFVVGLRLSNTEAPAGHVAASAGWTGMMVGPSLGYFRGGCSRRGITGIAIRCGLAAVGTVAATNRMLDGSPRPALGLTMAF